MNEIKRFVVTGGCGFIGSHLVELLVSFGHTVFVIDDLSSGYLSNIDGLDGDITIFSEKAQNFDYESLQDIAGVFHLAAQASVPYSISNFFESSSANMLSTFKVIEFCTERKIPLVYATSSAVYGNLPFGSESGNIELLSPYAADKYSMEMYTMANFNLNSLPSFGLRFFNVYGPRQDASSPYSGVISLFVDRIAKGMPITINGGHQTRDFIYVRDVVHCIYKSYQYLLSNNSARISNVLTGKSISINELVENLSSLMDKEPERIYQPLPQGDPVSSLGSTENLEMLLGVRCSDFVSIDDGLRDTINFMYK
jgi:UDP-glucose 4-epimerase